MRLSASTWVEEAEGSAIQGHSQLRSEFEQRVLHEISSEKETEIETEAHTEKKMGPVYLLRTFKEQNGE